MQDTMRVIRFLAAGGLNTGFGYVVFASCISLDTPIFGAIIISMIAGMIFNFYSYGMIAFQKSDINSAFRFIVFYICFGLVNYIALIWFDRAGITPLVGQAILTPPLVLTGYFGLRRFVFR